MKSINVLNPDKFSSMFQVKSREKEKQRKKTSTDADICSWYLSD